MAHFKRISRESLEIVDRTLILKFFCHDSSKQHKLYLHLEIKETVLYKYPISWTPVYQNSEIRIILEFWSKISDLRPAFVFFFRIIQKFLNSSSSLTRILIEKYHKHPLPTRLHWNAIRSENVMASPPTPIQVELGSRANWRYPI